MKIEDFNQRCQDQIRQQLLGQGDKTDENLIGVCATASAIQDRPRPASESDLHDDILEWVRVRGFLAIHSRMDRRTTTAKGVADFIIVTHRNVYFIECKRPGKKPTVEQAAFLAHVQKLGWPNAVVHSMQEFTEFMNGRL